MAAVAWGNDNYSKNPGWMGNIVGGGVNILKNPNETNTMRMLDPMNLFGMGSPEQSFDPYGGMPSSAGVFQNPYNPSYAAGINGVAQKNLLDQATSPGASPWASLMTAQQNKEQNQAMDMAAKNSQGATAGALSGLASSGGLTSGARERATEAGAKGYIGATQDAANQGTLNRMQVGINDEQNKLQNLGTVAGMENQDALARMGAQMHGADALNQWNQNIYNQNMQGWAAGKQAQATAQSGSGGKK